jgi:hypothetical protein
MHGTNVKKSNKSMCVGGRQLEGWEFEPSNTYEMTSDKELICCVRVTNYYSPPPWRNL